MANFDIFAPFLRSWEGGYVNNHNDNGGPTMRGVTLAVWQNYCKKHGLKANITTLKSISDAQWKDIMKGLYWDKMCADGIKSQSVANMVVDWAVNSGVTKAAKALQRAVGVAPDGVVGQKTLDAVNSNNCAAVLFLEVRKARIDFYQGLVKANPKRYKGFLDGWLNRTKSNRYGSLILNDKRHTEIHLVS